VTARLVGRGFRAASITCVTSLRFCCRGRNRPRLALWILSQRLQIFTSVKSLSLHSLSPDHAPLLQLPGVLPRLRHLSLASTGGGRRWQSLEAILSAMLAATQLTKLDLGNAVSNNALVGMAAQLASGESLCPSLAVLEVGLPWLDYAERFRAMLGGDPGLSVVRASVLAMTFPRHFSSSLAWVQRLELKRLDDPHVVETVATMTKLTRLVIEDPPAWMPELASLSKLAALQELSVGRSEGVSGWRGLPQIIAPMSELRVLEVPGYVWHLFLLASVFQSHTALTHLDLGRELELVILFVNPAGAMRSVDEGFGRLRALSLELQWPWDSKARPVTTSLTGLESLEVSGSCGSFLDSLPRMPYLTNLKIERGRVSGRILSRFPSLKELRLHWSLDERHWQEDVEVIAALTNLRVLSVAFPMHQPPGAAGAAQLWPLTGLRQLRDLMISPLRAQKADMKEFCIHTRHTAHDMGLDVSISTCGNIRVKWRLGSGP
jgi:hypothetical protein